MFYLKFTKIVLVNTLIISFFTYSSCKKAKTSAKEEEPVIPIITTPNLAKPLLEINYETGEKTSGINKLNTTNATANDASYMVSPGRTGNFAIAHKVTLGDQGYYSDNNWRSESATANVAEGKFTPGDERRYEFSLLLKDWTPYTTGMSENGDIIFQGKLAGSAGSNPAWYFMTKRNTITFRRPNENLQDIILEDYRPYINKWIDFRVDALWTTDATGYYKVYMRLPEETDYKFIFQINNFKTFNPDAPTIIGYAKWGLYRAGSSLANGDVPTRIIYHDDIRIYKLPLN